jgi:4-hydroxybenzoate polyprenyltransferase
LTSPLSLHSRINLFAADIKLGHSVFAMPWAVLACFLAADSVTPGARPAVGQVLLIVACMFFARTVAMAANRLLDARLDALNPRTRGRAVPSGRLSTTFVAAAGALCAAGFVVACAGFGVFFGNWVPLIAAVPVLAFVAAYPLMKRFTRLCHYYLGAALALAPVCAWAAVAGNVTIEPLLVLSMRVAGSAVPLLMAATVLLWTAGFDILYACQDVASDRETGVFSVPAAVGVARALLIARATHAACAVALVGIGLASPALGTIYFLGVGLAVALLVAEHAIVRADDLSKLNVAFFTLNGIMSVAVGTFGVIDVLVR